jgi:hypothetical protein
MDWHKRAQEELQEKAEWRERDIQVEHIASKFLDARGNVFF